MTAGSRRGDGGPGGMPWRASAPEVVIIVIVTLAVSAAAYGFGGAGAGAATFAGAGALALAVLRGLAPVGDVPPPAPAPPDERGQSALTAVWRLRSGVEAATETMAGYDRELRDTLQHLLAARLAERHGISLRDDPAAARRLLLGDESGGRGDRLWSWLDPGQAAGPDRGEADGIAPRTLAAILDRLERL